MIPVRTRILRRQKGVAGERGVPQVQISPQLVQITIHAPLVPISPQLPLFQYLRSSPQFLDKIAPFDSLRSLIR